MRDFCGGQGRTRLHDEAYEWYVEEVEPRRTQTTAKRSIYKQKLLDFPVINILVFLLAARHAIQSIGDDVKIAFKARR